jgi:hypothetical protein
MKDLLSDILGKILLRLQGIKYGVITVNITVHQGVVSKVEYITSEKEIVNERI